MHLIEPPPVRRSHHHHHVPCAQQQQHKRSEAGSGGGAIGKYRFYSMRARTLRLRITFNNNVYSCTAHDTTRTHHSSYGSHAQISVHNRTRAHTHTPTKQTHTTCERTPISYLGPPARPNERARASAPSKQFTRSFRPRAVCDPNDTATHNNNHHYRIALAKSQRAAPSSVRVNLLDRRQRPNRPTLSAIAAQPLRLTDLRQIIKSIREPPPPLPPPTPVHQCVHLLLNKRTYAHK